MKIPLWTMAACLSLTINGCEKMSATATPRTMLHTSDFSPDDFGILANKVVSRTGLSGPYQLLSGTIDDYVNQSGKPELVWLGGTEEDPFCVWVSYPAGSYLKLKWPTPSEEGFCQSAIECVISDLEQGGGTREKYIISDLSGPTWQVVSVIYGEEETEVDFSADDGDSLVSLMGALNNSENLPADWQWSISGGYLVLSAPHGTAVSLVEIAGGLEMEFSEPSVEGSPESQLTDPLTTALAGPLDAVIEQYEELLDTYQNLLGESIEASAATTEAAIESAYSAYARVNVRWTDADGDPRVSFKDPINGWYHPAEKSFAPVSIVFRATSGTQSGALDVSSVVPSDARTVKISITCEEAGGTGSCMGFAGSNDQIPHRVMARLTTSAQNSPDYQSGEILNSDLYYTITNGAADLIVTIYVIGWSR